MAEQDRLLCVLCVSVVFCSACRAPERPHEPAAQAVTLEIGRAGMALRGVAGDDAAVYAALSGGGSTAVEAPGTARLATEGGTVADEVDEDE